MHSHMYDMMQRMSQKKELSDLLSQNEGRRLEFKSNLPTSAELARTVIAFANDAGGDLLIGVNDDKTIAGLPENNLPRLEEQLSNMIYDKCYPAILPEISFMCANGKHLIRVHIYRGSMPPYHLKSEGRTDGTYVRVGSTNRKADAELISELERARHHVSYDGEVVYDKKVSELNIQSFTKLYKDKTGEECTTNVLHKLDLVRTEQGKVYPTRALILLSDDELRHRLFPNAKIECARFKGISAEVFIDQKSITSSIALQAEEAYDFILRHINEQASVSGVYTVRRWEYPVKAIREIVRNAVVHRQYAREGMNVKVAIYDDMVEITSPGVLPPSIDYSDMTSRQSDARNKTIATVFKRLGIIDQWGNGLALVAEELKAYPEIDFQWKEVGMSFQVQFIKKSSSPAEIRTHENDAIEFSVLQYIKNNKFATIRSIAESLSISKWQCETIIKQLQHTGRIVRTGSARKGEWLVREDN